MKGFAVLATGRCTRDVEFCLQCCIYTEDAGEKLHQPGAVGNGFRRRSYLCRYTSIGLCGSRDSIRLPLGHFGLVLHQLRGWSALERLCLLLSTHCGGVELEDGLVR